MKKGLEVHHNKALKTQYINIKQATISPKKVIGLNPLYITTGLQVFSYVLLLSEVFRNPINRIVFLFLNIFVLKSLNIFSYNFHRETHCSSVGSIKILH